MDEKQVCMEFARKIRDLMEMALVECLEEVEYGTSDSDEDDDRFNMLRELSTLTTELLKYDNIENKILSLANQSTVNGTDNEIKLKTFKMIRNVIAHFPIFDSYEDIIISEEILSWNDSKNGSVKKYFDEFGGKTLKCRIYYKMPSDREYKEIKTISFKIEKIDNGNTIKLCDMLSLNDAIWMFSIVDYYLDYLGLSIFPQFGLSM